jgi:hypothetical protein
VPWLRASAHPASLHYPCPTSSLLLFVNLLGGTENRNRRNCHWIRRFLVLLATDRFSILANRSLGEPNKPNQILGLNRMPRLRQRARAEPWKRATANPRNFWSKFQIFERPTDRRFNFFWITQVQTQMLNTQAHSPLWTHICKPYPYKHPYVNPTPISIKNHINKHKDK